MSSPSPVTTWSPQQEAVFAWAKNGSGSAILEAVAGSGKTTTLVELVTRLPGSVAFCAYNKAIATEIGARLKGRVNPAKVRSGTFHSFGFSMWRSKHGNVQVNAKKLDMLASELQAPDQYGNREPLVALPLRPFAVKAASLAKQWGIGALTPIDDASAWSALIDRFELEDTLDAVEARDLALLATIMLLQRSIATSDTVIDYDDMIYMPLVQPSRTWQYEWLLIDEAQDTNPARLALAKRLLLPGGRLIAVGDPAQAIFGFTGADAESLAKIAQAFNACTLSLTVSYRCPQAVVRMAQQWVPRIMAADTADEGAVMQSDAEMFWKHTDALTADDAILCRNTAPLVEIAFGLLRRGVACHVEGRDIGAGLIALVTKWRRAKTVGALRKELVQYEEREVAKAMAKGQEQRAEQVTDKVRTLEVILDSLRDDAMVSEAISAVRSLFSDSPDAEKGDTEKQTLTLCTVHRSKGREWQRVFWWGRTKFQPSPFARQDWQQVQEVNLMYVACTRAKDVLVEVNL